MTIVNRYYSVGNAPRRFKVRFEQRELERHETSWIAEVAAKDYYYNRADQPPEDAFPVKVAIYERKKDGQKMGEYLVYMALIPEFAAVDVEIVERLQNEKSRA